MLVRLTLVTQFPLVEWLESHLGDQILSMVEEPAENDSTAVTIFMGEQLNAKEFGLRLSIAAASLGLPAPTFEQQAVAADNYNLAGFAEPQSITIGPWVLGVHGANAEAGAGQYALTLATGNAFGDALHPTTRGCLQALHALGIKPQKVLDLGCGTGVLGLCAAAAYGSRVVMIDNDPLAVEATRYNAQINNLQNNVIVYEGQGYLPVASAAGPYNLIMANIFMQPLISMAPQLAAHLAPGGVAILSGILENQAQKVAAAHAAQGLAVRAHTLHNDANNQWAVLVLGT